MGFPRPECWSGLPLPPPGDLPNPGIKPEYPALAGDSLPLSHLGSLILPPSIGAQQAFEKLSHVEKQRGSKNECTFHPEITLAPMPGWPTPVVSVSWIGLCATGDRLPEKE